MCKIVFSPQPYKAAIIRLFAAFTALESFRQCYMRLCLGVAAQTGLSAQGNLIFLLQCFAVVTGMTLAPLIIDKTRISGRPARLTNFVSSCAVIAACTAVGGCYTSGYMALALQSITAASASGALAVCLRQMTKLLPPRRVGLAIGLAFAVTTLSGAALFSLQPANFEAGVVLPVLCGFLLTAALCFNASRFEAVTKQTPINNMRVKLPTKRSVHLFFMILCMFVLTDGLFDALYNVGAPFGQTLNYTFFILVCAAIICIAAGFAFEQINIAAAMICAFVLIGAGQSLYFFSPNAQFFYPYILSKIGNTLMQVILISLPVAFCAFSLQRHGILPGIGYILLYGGSLLIHILLELFPNIAHIHLAGAVIIASITAISMIVYMILEVKNARLRRPHKEYAERLADKP